MRFWPSAQKPRQRCGVQPKQKQRGKQSPCSSVELASAALQAWLRTCHSHDAEWQDLRAVPARYFNRGGGRSDQSSTAHQLRKRAKRQAPVPLTLPRGSRRSRAALAWQGAQANAPARPSACVLPRSRCGARGAAPWRGTGGQRGRSARTPPARSPPRRAFVEVEGSGVRVRALLSPWGAAPDEAIRARTDGAAITFFAAGNLIPGNFYRAHT